MKKCKASGYLCYPCPDTEEEVIFLASVIYLLHPTYENASPKARRILAIDMLLL